MAASRAGQKSSGHQLPAQGSLHAKLGHTLLQHTHWRVASAVMWDAALPSLGEAGECRCRPAASTPPCAQPLCGQSACPLSEVAVRSAWFRVLSIGTWWHLQAAVGGATHAEATALSRRSTLLCLRRRRHAHPGCTPCGGPRHRPSAGRWPASLVQCASSAAHLCTLLGRHRRCLPEHPLLGARRLQLRLAAGVHR